MNVWHDPNGDTTMNFLFLMTWLNAVNNTKPSSKEDSSILAMFRPMNRFIDWILRIKR